MSDSLELELSNLWKLCATYNERSTILSNYNDDPTVSHLGIAKTMSRITRKYYWAGIFRDIPGYIRKCESCQKYNSLRLERWTNQKHAAIGNSYLILCKTGSPNRSLADPFVRIPPRPIPRLCTKTLLPGLIAQKRLIRTMEPNSVVNRTGTAPKLKNQTPPNSIVHASR